MQKNEYTPLFLKYQPKYGLTDTPCSMNEYYRNKETPLQFIKDGKIEALNQKSQRIKNQMKKDKEYAFDISKNNYRKMVARDNVQYKFGAHLDSIHEADMFEQFQIRNQQKEDIEIRERQMRMKEKLKKKFIHGDQGIMNQNDESQRMTIDTINYIDTPNFQDKFMNVEFAQLFSKYKQESEYQKFHNPYEDISDNIDLDQYMEKFSKNLIDKDSVYGELSQVLLFDAENQISFWKNFVGREDDFTQQCIMSKCEELDLQKPKFTDFLDFSIEKLTPNILSKYIKIKQKQKTQMQLHGDQQNLQEQYYQKKAEYQMLKQIRMKDKNKRIAKKFVGNQAQTIDILEEKSFDSYFEEGCKDIFMELKDINEVREKIIKGSQPQQTKVTMLTNIGYNIKNILFRLLNLILVGEDFPEYSYLLSLDDKNVAQRKILELIYLHFDKIKVTDVDGIPKETVLNVYLQQREKNEKIFEILGRMGKKDKKNISRVPIKTNSKSPIKVATLKKTKK